MASTCIRGPTCPICRDIFSHPKVLACGHSFCLECLRPMAPRGTPDVKCPLCGKQTQIPNGDVFELPCNYGLQAAIDELYGTDQATTPAETSLEAHEDDDLRKPEEYQSPNPSEREQELTTYNTGNDNILSHAIVDPEEEERERYVRKVLIGTVAAAGGVAVVGAAAVVALPAIGITTAGIAAGSIAAKGLVATGLAVKTIGAGAVAGGTYAAAKTETAGKVATQVKDIVKQGISVETDDPELVNDGASSEINQTSGKDSSKDQKVDSESVGLNVEMCQNLGSDCSDDSGTVKTEGSVESQKRKSGNSDETGSGSTSGVDSKSEGVESDEKAVGSGAGGLWFWSSQVKGILNEMVYGDGGGGDDETRRGGNVDKTPENDDTSKASDDVAEPAGEGGRGIEGESESHDDSIWTWASQVKGVITSVVYGDDEATKPEEKSEEHSKDAEVQVSFDGESGDDTASSSGKIDTTDVHDANDIVPGDDENANDETRRTDGDDENGQATNPCETDKDDEDGLSTNHCKIDKDDVGSCKSRDVADSDNTCSSDRNGNDKDAIKAKDNDDAAKLNEIKSDEYPAQGNEEEDDNEKPIGIDDVNTGEKATRLRDGNIECENIDTNEAAKEASEQCSNAAICNNAVEQNDQ